MWKIKITPKKILVWSSFVILFVLVIVLTIVPVIFDIYKIDFATWMTNSLISLGIMICSIILGEIIGEDKQKENSKGLFQQMLNNYTIQLEKLVDMQIIVYFSQFYNWFKARELLSKKESYLIDHGFDQLLSNLIVKNIERDDLEQLSKGVLIKNDVKFRRFHEDEIEVLKVIYSTNFIIDAPEYTYYMSAFGDSTSVSTLEQAKKIEKKEHSNKTFNRVFKIITSLFISLIWGMATVKDATEGGAKEVAVNMASRMIALFGGLLSGFLTSVVAVKLATQKLENKTQVLKFMEIHYEKKEFIPKTYEEIVEEELRQEKTEDGTREE